MSKLLRGSLSRRVLWGAMATTLGMTVIALTSIVAFACTAIMGPLLLSPSSGPGGSRIMTSASGLKPSPAVYALHWTKTTTGDCMAFTGVLTLAKIKTDSSGQWNNVPVTIPKSKPGTYQVCGMELTPTKGNTATVHDEFTVT